MLKVCSHDTEINFNIIRDLILIIYLFLRYCFTLCINSYIAQVPKNPEFGADADRIRKEEQAKIDESSQLDEEELAEKDSLLKEVCLLRHSF